VLAKFCPPGDEPTSTTYDVAAQPPDDAFHQRLTELPLTLPDNPPGVGGAAVHSTDPLISFDGPLAPYASCAWTRT